MFDFLIQNIWENFKLLDPSGTGTPMMVWKELQAVWLQCTSSILFSNSQPFFAPPQKSTKNQPNQIKPNKNHGVYLILQFKRMGSYSCLHQSHKQYLAAILQSMSPRLTVTHRGSEKTKFLRDVQELQKYFKLVCNISCEAQYHRWCHHETRKHRMEMQSNEALL